MQSFVLMDIYSLKFNSPSRSPRSSWQSSTQPRSPLPIQLQTQCDWSENEWICAVFSCHCILTNIENNVKNHLKKKKGHYEFRTTIYYCIREDGKTEIIWSYVCKSVVHHRFVCVYRKGGQWCLHTHVHVHRDNTDRVFWMTQWICSKKRNFMQNHYCRNRLHW